MAECLRRIKASGVTAWPRSCPRCGVFGACSDPEFMTSTDEIKALIERKRSERDETAKRLETLDAETSMETRTVHDPFTGKDVQISNRLVDRLRGKYASGPHLPNGNPEFGWRQFQAPPIQHEAAARIEALELALGMIAGFNSPDPDATAKQEVETLIAIARNSLGT